MTPLKKVIVVLEVLCFNLMVHSLPIQATISLGDSPATSSHTNIHWHKVRKEPKYADDYTARWKDPDRSPYYVPPVTNPPTNKLPPSLDHVLPGFTNTAAGAKGPISKLDTYGDWMNRVVEAGWRAMDDVEDWIYDTFLPSSADIWENGN
jgi:hypothetical protein